jgi:hypothetical protein
VLPACCIAFKTKKGFLAAFGLRDFGIIKFFFFWFSAAAAKQSGGEGRDLYEGRCEPKGLDRLLSN